MNEELRRYMDELFAEAPQNKKVLDLKEELLGNMNEKYQDLLAEGLSPQEAYKTVVSGIGDVDELIGGIQQSPFDPAEVQKQRKKTALVVSVAIGIYMLALVLTAIADEFVQSDALSAVFFFVPCAAATCLLIYHFMSRPQYVKEEDTVVEAVKEWKSQENQKNSIKGTVQSIFWTLVTVAYFLVSFHYGNWHVSWVIFLIGAAGSQIINVLMNLRTPAIDTVPLTQERKRLEGAINGLLWVLAAVLYVCAGLFFQLWATFWVIFLIAGAVSLVVHLLFQMKR